MILTLKYLWFMILILNIFGSWSSYWISLVHDAHTAISCFQMEDVVARMQEAKNGIPIRTVKSFLSKIPSVISGRATSGVFSGRASLGSSRCAHGVVFHGLYKLWGSTFIKSPCMRCAHIKAELASGSMSSPSFLRVHCKDSKVGSFTFSVVYWELATHVHPDKYLMCRTLYPTYSSMRTGTFQYLVYSSMRAGTFQYCKWVPFCGGFGESIVYWYRNWCLPPIHITVMCMNLFIEQVNFSMNFELNLKLNLNYFRFCEIMNGCLGPDDMFIK